MLLSKIVLSQEEEWTGKRTIEVRSDTLGNLVLNRNTIFWGVNIGFAGYTPKHIKGTVEVYNLKKKGYIRKGKFRVKRRGCEGRIKKGEIISLRENGFQVMDNFLFLFWRVREYDENGKKLRTLF